MKRRCLLALLVALLAAVEAGSSRLMKRIRERQGSEEFAREAGGEGRPLLLVPQPLQDVLESIDDQLRGLDTLGYTLKLARLDFSLDQIARRMENIETRLGRLDTKLDLRMEKVEEVVLNKDIKEEFSNEHLSRRVESLGERVSAKAAHLEARLDGRLDRVTGKLELLERDLHGAADEIVERLVKGDEQRAADKARRKEEHEAIGVVLRDFGSDVRDALAVQVGEVHALLSDARTESERALAQVRAEFSAAEERLVRAIQINVDNLTAALSVGGCDNLRAALEGTLAAGDARLAELDSDVQQYTRKVSNGIQELWKNSDDLKQEMSVALDQAEVLREMFRRELRMLREQMDPLLVLEPMLASAGQRLDEKVSRLSATVDSSFASLLVAQNAFIESCRRVQQEETHVYDILQRVVHEMRNRSVADTRRIAAEMRAQGERLDARLAQLLDAVHRNGNATADLLRGRQLDPEAACERLEADRRTKGGKDVPLQGDHLLSGREEEEEEGPDPLPSEYELAYQLSEAEYDEDI